MRNFKIDIVETPDWLTEGLWHSFHKKIPLVVRLHGYHGFIPGSNHRSFNENTIKQKIVWRMERQLIKSADGISAVSNDYGILANNAYNLNRNITTIYNGFDGDVFNFFHHSNRDDDMILFVGRLQESKGIAILTSVIPNILKKHPQMHFVFVGKATRYKDTNKTWRDYIEERITSDNIEIVDPVPSEELISNYYSKATLCVFPSLFEPGGTVVQEAMMCGCPVIATKVGGLTEFINDGEDGILIPPANVNYLSDTINNLIEKPGLRKMLGENAGLKARKEFVIENTIELTLKLYQEAINNFNMTRYAKS